MNIGKIVTSFTKVFAGKSATKVLPKAESSLKRTFTDIHLVSCFTDKASGITKYEGTCLNNGHPAKITLESYMEKGQKVRRMQLFGENNPQQYEISRIKKLKTEENGSIWGGKEMTVEKDDTIFWCSNTKSKLTKSYNQSGKLEHKDLTWEKNVGNEEFTRIKATQDRVYEEAPLNHSMEDMLVSPKKHSTYKHFLSTQQGKDFPKKTDNYNYFADEAETNYSKAIKAREDAIIAAKKKAEAEALAAKEAAEKLAAETKAKQPRFNVTKLFGKDVNDLVMKEEKLADGTIKRTFTEKGSDKVLVETFDKGIMHEERIYGSKKADFIMMKQVGKDQPYIIAKRGMFTQIFGVQRAPYKKTINGQYYYDGVHSCEYRQHGSYYCKAEIKVPYDQYPDYINGSKATKRCYDLSYRNCKNKYAAELINERGERTNSTSRDTRSRFPEIFKAAKENWIDFKDLLSGYTV